MCAAPCACEIQLRFLRLAGRALPGLCWYICGPHSAPAFLLHRAPCMTPCMVGLAVHDGMQVLPGQLRNRSEQLHLVAFFSCREDLAVGDEVQVMPCNAADGKHVFHPPCLAPWLAENNSCPTCR